MSENAVQITKEDTVESRKEMIEATKKSVDEFGKQVDALADEDSAFGAFTFTCSGAGALTTSFAGRTDPSTFAMALMHLLAEAPEVAKCFINKLAECMPAVVPGASNNTIN